MEVNGIGQLNRFHCIINYGTQIVSLKRSRKPTWMWYWNIFFMKSISNVKEAKKIQRKKNSNTT